MEQEVYVDLYVLINTCMDLLCIMLTASLLHRFVRRWRAVLAAAAGGIYAVAALFLGIGGILGIVADVAVAIGICAIAFSGKQLSFRHFLHTVPVFLLVSVLLGGVMTALYALLNRLDPPLDVLQEDTISVWTFALLTAVAGFATAKGGRLFRSSGKTRSVLLHVTLFDRECTLRALVDSGNLLEDPLSGVGVAVADLASLRTLLPPDLFSALQSKDPTDWLADPRYARQIRLIPTHTATGDAVLPALKPQRLRITHKRATYDAEYLLALSPSLGHSFDGFDAIISIVE